MGRQWRPYRAADSRHGLSTAILLIAIFIGLVLVARRFCDDADGNLSFWPADGAIAVAAMVLPRRLTILTCVACLTANLVMNLADDYTVYYAILLAALNLALGVSVGLLTRRFCGAATDLTRTRRLSVFTGICFAAAALESEAGCVLERLGPIRGPYDTWAQWTLCDGLGLLLATPPILVALKGSQGGDTQTRERWMLLAGTLLLAVLGFTSARSPLFLLLYPALILMAFRAGPAWVQSAVLLICLIASSMTAHGQGPLVLLSSHGAWLGADVLQPYLVSLFLTAMPTNNALRELNRSAQRLRRLKAAMEHDATHDPLTDLSNRTVFRRCAAGALQDGTLRGVLFVDLDRFKDVNDALGHQAGDALLRAFGARLIAAVPRDALVARLGGDEFAVLLTRDAALTALPDIGAAIVRAAQAPFDLAQGQAHISASVGVAMAAGVDHEGAGAGGGEVELMRRADIALYAAKAAGRDRVRVFTPDLDEEVQKRTALESDLRAALQGAGGLALHYQVKTTPDGVPRGVEALLRWRHPQLGPIPPSRFIPVAEETGLIRPLGDWVVREAASFASRWPALSVAVNVSPLQLRDGAFVGRVLEAVQGAGVPAARIELEVTESVLVDEAGVAPATLARLREAGFRIALDDFGTGYSSMRQLQLFKVDRLKIDQSFIASLGSSHEAAAIVEAIVNLGHAMGLQVTAEGVETPRQWDILAGIGVDELQGYLFGRPVDEAALAAKLAPAQELMALTGD
jgi:diguanylate cyclase (GGDEF)-like protein